MIRVRAAAFPAAIFTFNYWLIHELFGVEYSLYMGSIESAFIALARFLAAHWTDASWYGSWYGGVPFESAYLPLLHYLVAGWMTIWHVSGPLAYHQVVATVYCLAPVSLYWLAVRLGASRWQAAAAGMVYSIISPCAFLVAEIRLDLGSLWAPRRMDNLLPYGEGPHQTALVFLPLAILALDRALDRELEKPRAARFALAAIAMAAVAATNWLGSFALGLSIICYWFSRGVKLKGMAQTAVTGIFAYLLVCVFLPPRNILTIANNASHLVWDYSVYRTTSNYSIGRVLIPSLLVALVLLFGLRRLFNRLRLTVAEQFFLNSAVIFTGIVLAAFWYKTMLLPQATRYQVEMDSSLVFAAVLIGWRCGRMAPVVIRWVLLIALLCFCFRQARFTRAWDKAVTVPIDVHGTIEYQTAMWCGSHVKQGRVYLTGSTSFWLNVWSDVPQLEGGFNNGIPDWNVVHADDAAAMATPESTVLWLKAFGVRYAEMVGGKSRNSYHYLRNPGKFSGKLPEARAETEDVIYQVDPSTSGLAHCVSQASLVHLPPKGFKDLDEIRRYVSAIDAEKIAPDFRWTTNHSFEVASNCGAGEVLSVQEAWYSGWKAYVGGKRVPLLPDGLGLMAIVPGCANCEVSVRFEPSRIPLILTVLAWMGCGYCLLVGRFDKRPAVQQ